MEVSRRRVLGALATGAATSACRTRPRTVQARFVGQLAERGHRLRDGGIPTPTAVTSMKAPVVIIGAGAAGLSAAWRLRRAGVRDVVLLEMEPAVGGTARGGELPRSRYPMGAHYLPAPPPDFRGLRTLLGDLGVIHGPTDRAEPDYDLSFVCRGPVERHRYKGRWEPGLYPTLGQTDAEQAQFKTWRDHLRQLARRTGTDGRRLFALPVRDSSTQLRHLDGKSMAAYLDELGLDSWRLRWTVDYACRDDYGATLQQTSAFAGLHHYLSRGLEDERDRFILTWPQGNGWLAEQLTVHAELGDRLRRDTVAHAIDPDAGVVHAWDAAANEHLQITAETILWAAPRFVLPRVLPPGRDPLPTDALSYSPWLVASVQVDEAPGGIGADPAWDNVPVGADNLGYVVATHTQSLADARVPGSVLTYYEPLTGADVVAERTRLLRGSLQHWTDHVVAALEQMHPDIAPTIGAIDIARWGHAMVRPVVGHLFGPGLATARANVGRVVPCAADVGGLPLFEEAFTAGVLAAEGAIARLGRRQESIL